MGAATDEVQRAWLRQGPVCACGPKAPMYYRGADAALVVYDLTSRDTFDGLAGWVKGMPASRRPPPLARGTHVCERLPGRRPWRHTLTHAWL